MLTLTILIGGSLEEEIYKYEQCREDLPEAYPVTTTTKNPQTKTKKNLQGEHTGLLGLP